MRPLKISQVFDHKKNVLWSLYIELSLSSSLTCPFAQRTKSKVQSTKYKTSQLEQNRSSVNINRLPVDSTSFFRSQQQGEGGDFFRGDHSVLRAHARDCLKRVFSRPAGFGHDIFNPPRSHLSIDIARTNCVHGHALFGDFQRHGAGKSQHSML